MPYHVTVPVSALDISAPCLRNASTSPALPGLAFNETYNAYFAIALTPPWGTSAPLRRIAVLHSPNKPAPHLAVHVISISFIPDLKRRFCHRMLVALHRPI